MSYGLHGRKRQVVSEAKLTKQRELEKEQVENYLELTNALKTQAYNNENVIFTSSKLLLENPDEYTVWNLRRKSLETFQDFDLSTELKLTLKCLKIRPKTYWVWNHRLWSLKLVNQVEAYRQELGLCDTMLNLDNRNFHCWDYRRQILSLLTNFLLPHQTLQVYLDEMDFSKKKLEQSFSNFSAWHYRQNIYKFISELNFATGDSFDWERSKEDDMQLVRNAIFTDPEDQSAWFQLQIEYNFNLKKFCKLQLPKLIYKVKSQQVLLNLTFVEKVHLVHTDFEISVDGKPISTKNKFKPLDEGTHDFNFIYQLPLDLIYQKDTQIQIKFASLKFKSQNSITSSNSDLEFAGTLQPTPGLKFNNLHLNSGKSIPPLQLLDPTHLVMEQLEKFKTELSSDIQLLKELNEMAEEYKWPYIILLFLNQKYKFCNGENTSDQVDVQEFYNQLIKLDPLRKSYYQQIQKLEI